MPAASIAKWDGNAWSTLGAGLGPTSAFVDALAFDPLGRLYASGEFTTAGGAPANHIAMWDGNNWFPLGSGANNFVFSIVADTSGRLFAAGGFNLAGTNVSSYIAQANVVKMASQPHRNPNGSFTFNALSRPNSTNRVLASATLGPTAVWTPIFTNVAPVNGMWQFTDPNASQYSMRQYLLSTP